MRKFQKFIIAACALALLAASCDWFPTDQSAPTSEEQQTAGQQSFFYDGIEGEAALVTLKRLYTVETKDFGSGLGEFVESIDGLRPAADEFWAFYINGKSSTIGAGSYTAKTGDLVEWRIEKINE